MSLIKGSLQCDVYTLFSISPWLASRALHPEVNGSQSQLMLFSPHTHGNLLSDPRGFNYKKLPRESALVA